MVVVARILQTIRPEKGTEYVLVFLQSLTRDSNLVVVWSEEHQVDGIVQDMV